MQQCALLLLLFTLLFPSHWTQGAGILGATSPELRGFLKKHPAALQCLTNALVEAFTNRTVQLYYFYSDDDSTPRAFHSYPSPSVVSINLRENQKAFDQFICLTFEVLNSEGENRFRNLYSNAQSGSLSRAEFVRETLKTEFHAVKRTRDLLRSVRWKKKDASGSYYYERFIRCPDTFEEFLSYTKSVSPRDRDPVRELERKYDSLSKK